MRIPLDYYRILGIPNQADAQQLSQSYHDRALQLPRREYSDLAISTRKQLLDEAYTILSEPERRTEYDNHFLTASPGAGDQTVGPLLDVHPEQFIGALLLLYELGEYEQVLQLAQPLLEADAVLVPEQAQLLNNPLTRADIVLTVALSCLELGREQWQQGQSDRAAETGQYGQEILLREGLFPGIRGELRADFYKLRPYRVLELLTRAPDEDTPTRAKGLHLLNTMLSERKGIEGQGDDQSGLNLDDFLRFIQQIRTHLTTTEQQDLFAIEAQRPSAVGTYLLAYAAIAQGFAYHQPERIAYAQTLLQRLGSQQDLHLEQAVCALLLGQPAAANRALERSQEYEPLAFIRENSQDSPDLLPGLCLYAERWLETEVFPHFKDLMGQPVALTDYFANAQVQRYLEQLSGVPAAAKVTPAKQAAAVGAVEAGSTDSAVAVAPAPIAAEAVAETGSETTSALSTEVNGDDGLMMPVPEESDDVPVARRTARRRRRNPWQNPLVLLGLGGAIAVLGLAFLVSQLSKIFFPPTPPEPADTVAEPTEPVDTTPLEISLAAPPVPIPTGVAAGGDPSPVIATDQPLDEILATEIVQTWLAIKAQALGPEYKTNQFKDILAEPVLTEWQQWASEMRDRSIYREYEHTVEVERVITDSNNPDFASVEAAVRETARSFRNGQEDPADSYDENLRVRYDLVRQGDQWLIQNMQVIE